VAPRTALSETASVGGGTRCGGGHRRRAASGLGCAGRAWRLGRIERVGFGLGSHPATAGQEDGDEQRQGRNKMLVIGAVDGQGEISFLGYRLFACQQIVNAAPLYQTLLH
jgi:hypothetical protein